MNGVRFGTYKEAVDWLFIQLPNYQLQGASAYKPGLDTIKSLLKALDNPQRKFKSIHVAGTNGKGSTCHMLASIYQEGGYKTGVFTSPHIIDFRERIKINGRPISEQFVLDFLNQNYQLIDDLKATFFEITAAMSFIAFEIEQVDIAIIETGLGGRLDATNVILPELSVITNIGIDHVQFLGDTIPLIAAEKAGIIKQNTPVLIGTQQDLAAPIFAAKAQDLNADLAYANPHDYQTDLLGKFQIDNARTAVTAVQILQNTFPIDIDKIEMGLMNVAQNTGFIGRFQKIQSNPTIILDAAHNPDGIQKILAEIKEMEFGELHIIYGSSNDKDVASVFEIFPKDALYYFAEFETARSMKVEQFEDLAAKYNLRAGCFESSVYALEAAKNRATEKDLILVCGSFFILQNLLA